MAAGSDLLTVTEAAEALKSSGQSVRNWIRAGQLRSVRIGNRFLIPRGEIERMRGDVDSPTGESPWDYAADGPASPLVHRGAVGQPEVELSEEFFGG